MFDSDFMPPMPLAFFQFAFALFIDILWAAAISYGASMVAQQFGKKPKQRLPDLGGYPIQTSQKGIAIPKVYGCERVAGNVIWMGEQNSYEKKTHQPGVDGHVRIKTYYKDFLIGIAEGSGSITKIWNGKVLIWAADGSGTKVNNDTQTITVSDAGITAPTGTTAPGTIFISKGNGTQDARFYNGEDFGKYGDLIWAWFENFETGPTPNIPNFSFEICTSSGYKYTYISQNGALYGIPVGAGSASTYLIGDAVDVGGGIVGLPMVNNVFVAGDLVIISNTTNYNQTVTLEAGTTESELRITDAFNAETFDGSERVVRVIGSLTSGTGHSAQDAAGNIYYGHIWSIANNTFVTKIEPDGTLVYDYLDMSDAPPEGDTASQVQGLIITPDGKYLYILVSAPGTTNHGYIYKWDLTDGSEEWVTVYDVVTAAFLAWPQFGLDVDSDGNSYHCTLSGNRAISKITSDGVTMSKLTLMGEKKEANITTSFPFVAVVDNDMGVVITAGSQFAAVGHGYPDSSFYNLAVRTFDDSDGDQILVGPTFINAGLTKTYGAANASVVTLGGFIYVLMATPDVTIYKISWDGTNLAHVSNVAAPTYAVGLYVDLNNNLVVINQDTATSQTDVLHYYDANLNLTNIVDGYNGSMLNNWDSAIGGGSHKGSISFYPGIGAGSNDENPATMIEDLATQDRYGAGISQVYINAASIAEERGYWAQQNNEISLALTEQLPFMDWVDFILSHCNGFRHWSEGQFHLGAFKDEASIVSLDQDDIVRDEGDDPPPPVQIVKRKASETTNRVEVSWVDRSNTYDAAVAMSKDDVDQRVSGKVRINPIDLRGIHNATLAEKQAYRLLFEGMYRFTIYSFDVSFKNMLYTVGDVISVSDGGLLTDQRMRIIAREEDKDGRAIHIEAVEDVSELYPEIAYNTQETLADPDVPVGSDDLVTGTLSFREHVTQSRLYMFFAPGDSDTDGALVYRSYDNITYLFIGRLAFDKDSLPNSAGTTTSALPLAEQVIHRYDESFTVDIGTITSLRTDVSDEELFAQQSMCKVGDEIIGFKTAEDQGSGIWHVSNLIRGMFGTGGNAHAIGATFATVSLIDIAYALDTEESGQTVYWKALATTGPTVSQTLADVTATAYTVVRESERPYPMSLVRVRDNVFGEVSAYPVIVDFNLPSKTMGYNLGGFGEGGWGEFVKDERITGVLVTLKTLAGVEISQAIYSLDGYHADNYDLTLLEVDRAGNDPVDVILQPVTSLASVKESNVIVDIV